MQAGLCKGSIIAGRALERIYEVEVLEQHESAADDSISITEQIDQVMSLFQDQSRPPAALIDFKLEELLDYETMEEDQVLTHYTQVTILMYSNLNVIVI